jgi:hypothetical protein
MISENTIGVVRLLGPKLSCGVAAWERATTSERSAVAAYLKTPRGKSDLIEAAITLV